MAKRSATDEVAPQAKLCKLDPPDAYEAVLKPMCEMKGKTLAHATFENDTQALCKLDKLDKPDVWKWEDVLKRGLDRVHKNAMLVMETHPETLGENPEALAQLVRCLEYTRSLRSWIGRPEVQIGRAFSVMRPHSPTATGRSNDNPIDLSTVPGRSNDNPIDLS